MVHTVKWVVLAVMFALITMLLYRFIDSSWSEEHNASIVVTIAFFGSAMATILSAFSAIDASDKTHHHV